MILILDTQMAVLDGQIVHHHYAKPLASLEVTLKRSAMSISSKYNILVQEGNRRLRNMSNDIAWNQKVHLINLLMIQMTWAEYNLKDREIVARRIVAKLDSDLLSYQNEGKPYYRSKEERRETLKANKATWFRALGATSTLRAPMTEN